MPNGTPVTAHRPSTQTQHTVKARSHSPQSQHTVAAYQTVRPDPFRASAHGAVAHHIAECRERVRPGGGGVGCLDLLELGQAELVRTAEQLGLDVLKAELRLTGKSAERLEVLRLQGLDLEKKRAQAVIWTAQPVLGRIWQNSCERTRRGGTAAHSIVLTS